MFWGLIKLSEVYTENFIFKINYLNIPAEKQLTRLADSTLNVNVEANGFSILKHYLFDEANKIEIDLTEMKIMRDEGNSYFVYTQELKESFVEIFEVAEGDFSFSKTTLGFTLEDLQSKEVVVVENHKLGFKPQFDLYAPAVISPEKIIVYGPKDILDTLRFVFTERIELKEMDENKNVKVGLRNPLPSLLHFEPDVVTMDIRVEKFTEKFVETGVDFTSINKEIKSFPSTIRINFKIAQKDFNLAQPSQFHIVPVIEGIDFQTAEKLQLKLIRKPEFIRNEWIVPAEVEFLIVK